MWQHHQRDAGVGMTTGYSILGRSVAQMLEASTALQPGYFSTKSLPAKDQFDAWRVFMSDLVDLQPTADNDFGLSAEFVGWDLGGLLLTRATFDDAAERHWRHWQRSFHDHWCVVVARGAGGQAPIPHASFRSLSRPFEGCGRDSEVLTLLLPREQFKETARELDLAQDAPISPAMDMMLCEFLDSLARNVSAMDADQREQMAAAARAMILACLVPRPDRLGPVAAPVASVMIDRARQVARQNMAMPDFGPEQLCRLLAVSRSKLYRYFEPLGGVARFVQQERLMEARRRLADTSRVASIQVVAAEVGFLDHSTFSRAFRREFGYSPSEAREKALAGLSLDEVSSTGAMPDPAASITPVIA